MSMYRTWYFDSMEKSLVILEQLLSSITDISLKDKRDGGNGWTISEVVGHLVDTEHLFLERAKLTVDDDNPILPSANPDEKVIQKGYASQDALDLLQQWRNVRADFMDYLKSLPDDESTWERPAKHPSRGDFSLNMQLALASWHDTNHIHQIVKIING